ncbi:hypothetical protein ABIE49_003974 [Bradyrhizobium sp. OAE829]
MRRILVVDDDLHTRLAIRAWLKQCGFRVAIADGGPNGLAALDDATFDLMIVDVFMPNMRGFERDQDISPARPDSTVDRNFRLRVLRPGNGQCCLPKNGSQPRCDQVPPQTVPASDIAQRDRRMSVGSRAAPKIRRHPCRRHSRALGTAGCNGIVEYFEREDRCGLSCQQDVTTSRRTRKGRRLRSYCDWGAIEDR